MNRGYRLVSEIIEQSTVNELNINPVFQRAKTAIAQRAKAIGPRMSQAGRSMG